VRFNRNLYSIFNVAAFGTPRVWRDLGWPLLGDVMKLLLIQGANMEYLGPVSPELYGTTTAKELELDGAPPRPATSALDLGILYNQHRRRGGVVIFRADRQGIDGVLFNPAGFLHAGHALRDCLK